MLDKLIPGEARDGDEAVCRSSYSRQGHGRVPASPCIECARMSQHGEVMHGDDERHRGVEGRPVCWTVENVDAVGSRSTSELWIPLEITPELGAPAFTGHRVLDQLDFRVATQPLNQSAEVARRAGSRELERGDVYAHAESAHGLECVRHEPGTPQERRSRRPLA